MNRDAQTKAWSELAKHGICSEGDLIPVLEVSLEEAIGDALIAARHDARLFVAARNIFLLRSQELSTELVERRIQEVAETDDDRLAALRCLGGLCRKAGLVAKKSVGASIAYFSAGPRPRQPDADMLAVGLIVQRFSTEPVWRYIEPRLLKAQ